MNVKFRIGLSFTTNKLLGLVKEHLESLNLPWDISEYNPDNAPSGFDLNPFNIILTDSSYSGIIPYIIISDSLTDKLVVDSIKAGATDFIHTSNIVRLKSSIETIIDDFKNNTYVTQTEHFEFWKTLTSTLADVVVIIDRDKNIQYLNKTISGAVVDDCLGKPLLDYCAKGDLERICRHIDNVFENGEIETYKTGPYLPDAQCLIFESRVSPVYDGNIISSVLIVSTDITKRENIQNELESSLKNQSDAQKLAKLGSFEHDLLTEELKWSDGTYELYKIDKNKFNLTIENVLSMMYPDDREKTHEAKNRILEEKSQGELKFRMILADGEIIHIHSKSRVELDDKGNAVKYIGVIQDVTKQYFASQALKESEAKFRSFLDNHHGILYQLKIQNSSDIETSKLTILKGDIEEITGYDIDQFMSREISWIKLVHPDDFDLYMDETVKILADHNYIGECSYRIIRSDGSIRWVKDTGYMITFDEQLYVQGHIMDVTAQKLAEDTIDENAEKLRLFINNIRGITYQIELDEVSLESIENYSFMAGIAEEITGYSCDEFMSEKVVWKTIMHPDDRHIFDDASRQIRTSSNKDVQCDYRIIRRDGSVKWVRNTAQLIKDIKGEKTFVQGFVVDINERKLAKLAHRESEERFRNLVQQSPFAIEIFDENGDLLDVNPAWQKQYNVKDEDIPKSHNIIKYIERFQPELIDVFKKVYNGESVNIPATMVDVGENPDFKDDKVVWTTTSIYPIKDSNEKVTSIVILHNDVTDQKLAELEIDEKNQELVSAIKIQKDLIAMVSHELRTPLIPIIGYSELLLDGSFGILPEDMREPVKIMLDRGLDLTKLIEDLLTVSSIENHKFNMTMQPIIASEIVKNCVDDYSSVKFEKEVKFILSVGTCHINIDQFRFKQIINNLIDNCIKYSKDSVKIEITSKCDGSGSCIFTIKDNGIGISKENLPHIFDKFYQAEKIDTRIHGGAGLGLAIVKEIIEAMNGSITVESALGSGTIFTLSFPVVQRDCR